MPKRDVVLSLERRPATASSGSSGVLPLHNHDESYYTESEINARLADLLDKTTYDPDGDGKVQAADAADTAPWSGITGKPLIFPPSTHDHDALYYTKADVNLLFASYAGIGHAHDSIYGRLAAANAWTQQNTFAGNVGIGTLTPVGKLNIEDGDAYLTHTAFGYDAAPTGDYIVWTDPDEWPSGRIRVTEQLNDSWYSSMVFEVRDADPNRGMRERMRLTNTGYMGLATKTPNVPLEVFHSTSPALRLSYTNQFGWDISNSSGDASFRLQYMTGNNVFRTVLRATYDGFTTIGDNDQAYDALEVHGGLAVTGVNSTNGLQPPALNLGYTSDQGYVQAVDWGIAHKPLMLQPYGNPGVGIGVPLGATPQGSLHVRAGSLGSLLFVTKTGISTAPVTLVPNGEGDAPTGAVFRGIAKHSTAGNASTNHYVVNNSYVIITVGSELLVLRVNADGSIDCYRTPEGTGTWSIAVEIIWM